MITTPAQVTQQDYAEASAITWCPGCGNFGILRAMRKALVDLQLPPDKVLMVSGIGQAGKFPHYTHCNVFNGLHGRPIPPAIGAKLANPELTVIAVSGDGDAYGEGGNHFIHAMNRNVNITYMVHNNGVYALTKGQAAPTTDLGFTTRMNPQGAWVALRALALAVACDCSFIARGFAGDPDHLAELIKKGITHKGFALIEVLQPCVTYNSKNTFKWYSERVYKLENEPGYDPSDRTAAFNKSLEWGDRIPIGVIYQKERPLFDEYIGTYGKTPLVKEKIDPMQFEELMDEFM
ncbi:MAG: 2-oxoacid:ferredoxin oxidoreductase subunit beta [Dehalococcoidales bacterium]|nr:2-oxoacid:ferredoxin oxidoreductase subunit beta [Dehalococcoidales bacterium]